MTVRTNKPKQDDKAVIHAMMQKYNIPQNFLDDFLSESTTKSVTIKKVKKDK
jgi:hypothetical protein